ncbi:MAG: PaaI family thioesterase [Mycolicibacterium sp.]|uniref:PaaI family thioesterase n=1 Tax=Mycolicibacterium sp. TaxID=2320850 RepID=UPI003D0BA4B1
MTANESADETLGAPEGGGFGRPEPTTGGGADYGRFVEAVRDLQDHARAADAPDEVITEVADLLEKASQLLAPYDADEWTSPSGRRMDLPNRGNILQVPAELHVTEDGRIAGCARFRRYHLGRNGAAHGGAVALLFDSMLGFTAFKLTAGRPQRTAFLHVDYRSIAPVERQLSVDAGIDAIEGRKIFVSGRIVDRGDVLAEGHALFVKLKPGQP